MTVSRIRVGVEVTPRRAFAAALDWPGWCRAGKTPDAAVEALLAYAGRYGIVARPAGVPFPPGAPEADIVETRDGDATTAFGAPSITFDPDREPTTRRDAERLVAILEASWQLLDRTAATAPAELRKGPRGGGRDTPRIVEHVVGAEQAYARQIGLRLPAPEAADGRAVAEMRGQIAAVLGRPSDGSPLAKWTQRYAARRIGWHVLDHAWEIQDRTD